MKNKKKKVKNTVVKKNKLITFIWIIATILEWVNIVLFMAALGRDTFQFSWYNAILTWPYRAETFYICGAIDLLLFSILVMYYHKRERYNEMLLGLFCFTAQIFLLAWKIKL